MKTSCKIVLIMILALTGACSPSHRLANLIAAHPELTTVDNLLVKDTIPIPLAEADTCLTVKSMAEPVFITQGRLEMEIGIRHDTIHLKGKCKPDTIIRVRSIPFERIKLIKPNRTDAIIAHIPWLVGGMIAIMVSGGLALHKLNIC